MRPPQTGVKTMAPPLARFLGYGILAKLTGDDESEEELEEIWLPVSSTAIRAIGWRGDGVIIVEFNQRGTYTYEGSKELFLAFAAAPSKGQFFNQHFQVKR